MPFKANNKTSYISKITLITSFLLLPSLFSHASTKDVDKDTEKSFQVCLDHIKNTADFSRIKDETFDLYRPTQADFSVLDSLNYQPEFDTPPWDYHSALVDVERVRKGIELKHQLLPILSKIENEYGVKKSDILAVWGIESNYGQSLGKKNILTSLATLSCFGRRQTFFRKEFSSALLIIQNGDVDSTDMNGSWAGAFGQTQFMPSTYLSLAQDFDKDGKKDLVNSQLDALASTANFLKNAGYRYKEPWGYEVSIPINFSGASNIKNKKNLDFWRSNNFKLVDGSPLPNQIDKLALLMPSGPEGPAFLIGRNFDTFYNYNASENYALAIAHLSILIESESLNINFHTPWPTDDPGINRQQRKDIQKALIFLGYDIGEVDGLIGSKSREAIKSFQSENDLKVDGRAGKKLYDFFEKQGYFNNNSVEENQQNADSQEVTGNIKANKTSIKYILFGLGLFISAVLLLVLIIKRKITYK